MNAVTVSAIAVELDRKLKDRLFGRVYVLSRGELAIDLRLGDGRFLYISAIPEAPRIYLIRRRLKEIEKAALPPTPFAMLLKKHLSGLEIESVAAVANERIVKIALKGTDEMANPVERVLIAQLTGRSANIVLTDAGGRILGSLRAPKAGDLPDFYSLPERPEGWNPDNAIVPNTDGYADLSSLLEFEDGERFAEAELRNAASAARSKAKAAVAKLARLESALENDLESHGDAEEWKLLGDLLLANASTAKRTDEGFVVIDYFSDDQAERVIEADVNGSATAAAERYFKRYTKARNARGRIVDKLKEVASELAAAEMRLDIVENAAEAGDLETLRNLAGHRPKAATAKEKKQKRPAAADFARTFFSSEGYEILVGKRAKDNDHLTFRAARSLDTWMHAADYPGSHVVIRNQDRKPIPPNTLLEAAQLAAFYSQGKTQPKAAVHYTEKKFVNKPKGAAPGLVSLSSFKTILVEPKVPESVTRPQDPQ